MRVGDAGGRAALAMLIASTPASVGAAQIRWTGSENCRRELEVREQVESMTERRLADVPDLDFELALEALAGDRVRLLLTTKVGPVGGATQRTLEGPSCVDVTDAAAVAIALTIGTPASPKPDESPSAAPPEPDLGPESRPPRVRAREGKATQSSERFRVAVGISGSVDSSVTPNPVLGGALHVVAGPRSFRLELEGAVFAPSRRLDAAGQGGTFQLAYGASLLCAVRPAGPVLVLLCGGYELGSLSAEGEGVADSYRRQTLWHAARAELGVLWPVGPSLRLSGRLGGALALARPPFVLDAPEAVHRSALLSLRAGLGFELTL